VALPSRSNRWRAGLGVLCVTTALTAGATTVRASTPLPSLTAASSEAPQSIGEVAGVTYDERDGGYSASLGNGTSLWLFGDSQIVSGAPVFSLKRFVTGSTAAIGPTQPGSSLHRLRDVVIGHGLGTASTVPNHFLSNPTSLPLPAGQSGICTNSGQHFPVRWPTGIVSLGSAQRLLVTYVDACVFSATSYSVQGSGIAVFNANTFTFGIPPTDIVPPAIGPRVAPRYFWSSPVREPNGVLDVFATANDSPGGTSLYVAQLLPTGKNLIDPSHYRPIASLPSGGGSFPIGTFSIGLYPSSTGPVFRAVESVDHSGTVMVWTATQATGPWTPLGQATLPGCSLAALFCWTEEGHPELSSPTTVEVTYYRPGDPSLGLGHLAAATITLTPPTS